MAVGDGFEPRYRFDLVPIEKKYRAYAKCSVGKERVQSTFAIIARLEGLPNVTFALTM